MKIIGIAAGVIGGVIGYYALSLASAFWVGQQAPTDYTWSILLAVGVCLGLGLLIGWRASAALAAFSTMLILVAVGYITGSDFYQFAAPLPADVKTLFFHGARTPLVVGPTVLLGAAAVWRMLTNRRSKAGGLKL